MSPIPTSLPKTTSMHVLPVSFPLPDGRVLQTELTFCVVHNGEPVTADIDLRSSRVVAVHKA